MMENEDTVLIMWCVTCNRPADVDDILEDEECVEVRMDFESFHNGHMYELRRMSLAS